MFALKMYNSYNFKLLVIYAVSLFVLWRNSAGDDIALARQIYRSPYKSDYLGATGTVFFGLIPNSPLSWWHLLLIIQLSLAAIGLFFISQVINLKRNSSFFIFFSYITLVYSGASSRDGIMLSILIFAIGMFIKSKSLPNFLFSKTTELFAYASLIIAFSFRPWLSIVLLPIYFWNNSIQCNKKVFSFLNLVFALFLIVAPLCVDQANKKMFHLNSHFPQQMVMLHDLSTTYCWGSNSKASAYSEKALNLLATNPESLKNICQFYRPNTWQAIVFPNKDFLSVKSLQTPITLIGMNDFEKYNKFRSYWISTILNDPFTYLQNHLTFAVQVIISGDTRGLRLVSFIQNMYGGLDYKYISGLFYGLFLLPVDLITTFHLLSPLLTIIALLLIYRKFSWFYASFVIWIGMTTLAYASDNGRYTIGGSILAYLGIFLDKDILKKRVNY